MGADSKIELGTAGAVPAAMAAAADRLNVKPRHAVVSPMVVVLGGARSAVEAGQRGDGRQPAAPDRGRAVVAMDGTAAQKLTCRCGRRRQANHLPEL